MIRLKRSIHSKRLCAKEEQQDDPIIPSKRARVSRGTLATTGDVVPVRFEDMTQLTPAGAVLKSRRGISSKDLPPECLHGFRVAFRPAIRDICGTLVPWESPSDADVVRIWNSCFPKHRLGTSQVLHTIVSKLVDDIVGHWRRDIAAIAVECLNVTLESLYDNQQERIEHATWLLGDDEKDRKRPFYYKQYEEGRPPVGMFQSPIVAATLATHLASISRLPEESQLQVYPTGALALSILALKRALTWAKTGVGSIPQTPEGYFSRSNWGDHHRLEGGRYVLVKTSTNVVRVVNKLTHSQWEKILTEAEKYVVRGNVSATLQAFLEEEAARSQSDFELEDGDGGLE